MKRLDMTREHVDQAVTQYLQSMSLIHDDEVAFIIGEAYDDVNGLNYIIEVRKSDK